MTNPSKNTGDRAELAIAAILARELGLPVQRKLGAGRREDTGDLHGLPDLCAEVKYYPRGGVALAINEGLADLEREQQHAGSPFGTLFVKRPRLGWIAVQTVPGFCALYREVLS